MQIKLNIQTKCHFVVHKNTNRGWILCVFDIFDVIWHFKLINQKEEEQYRYFILTLSK